jgi:Tfp pilus assembly protein PilX
MKTLPTLCRQHPGPAQQRGLVLFFALIALVAMSLAALTLVRSVNTTTLIAGNLAFRQAATTSSDAGGEAAIVWITSIQNANAAMNVLSNAAHPFNITDLATRPGYHSNVDPALDLSATATWNDSNNVRLTWDAAGNPITNGTGAVLTDGSGNTIRYIIQRLCRTANQPVQTAGCLFSGAVEDKEGQNVKLPQDVCKGAGCPVAGQSPMIRVTVRTSGPKNSISYVQAYVY